MINLTTCNEWQRMDPELNIPQPWYTFPALDEICTWDLSDKSVLEIGGGASTVWWNRKAKKVLTVEPHADYRWTLGRMGFRTNVNVPYGPEKYDIAIVDNDGERDGYIFLALTKLKENSILIIDNWIQPSVDWMPSQIVIDQVSEFKHKIYSQPGHPDWKTLICWL